MTVNSRLSFISALAAGCWLLASAASAPAQAPSITSTFPQAVRPGESVDVTIRGDNLAGVTELWTSFPCETALSPDVKENSKNNEQVVYRINVPAEAYVGVHAIRVATPRGVSALKLLVLDDLPSIAQDKSNKTPDKAQQVSTSAAIDGVVDSLSQNYFKFEAQAGQSISFEVLARRIGSALDPTIRILAGDGHELIYSDDVPGLSGDSRVCYTFQDAGQYLLELRDIRYQGGGNYFFRLRIGDFPCVTVPDPMGAKRGSDLTLNFAGTHIDDVQPLSFKIPTDPQLSWITVGAKRVGGTSSGFAILSVGDGEEFVEKEPNDTAEKANHVPLGASLNGRMNQPGDTDGFVFSAKKGQKLSFRSVTRSQGSPCDLTLKLLNAKGGKVADSGTGDGSINATFPADGDYTLLVRHLNRKGGDPFGYRIAVTETRTGFTLSASADRVNVPAAGGTGTVSVVAGRNGYNGPIAVAVTGLPQGITSVPTVIGPGLNSVVLTLKSSADAPAGQIIPVRIVGTAKIGDAEVQSEASVIGALKGALNGMLWPPQFLSEATVVGLGPKAPFSLRTEPAELVFGRDKKATVKIIVERQSGFDEEITLALNPLPKGNPQKGGLPGGVSAAFKPIPKGKNEIEVVFSGNNKAVLGHFTATIVATHKKGKTTTTQYVPGIALKLQEPSK